jgi:TolB-like protein
MRFWQELRRRRVFRLAGLYVVGAWLVVQVGDIVLPAWALPETAMRYLIVGATLCFPIALVFAWFYDITPNGIVRTKPAGESESASTGLKRSDYAILAALLFIAGTILVGSIDRIVQTKDATVDVVAQDDKPPNSLAVLPFENLDPNPDTEYFSNGISEEILHKLSSVSALRVLGRTSSFAFGNSDQGPKRISDILGVRYILGGTVRREANKVRITARLLDDAGFQIWSASFDGALESIFDLQSSIASEVASQITSELVKPIGGGSKTDNMEAYRYYLVGREYFNKRPPNWHLKAEEAFRKAIAEDPGFAPSYVGLANSMGVGVGTHRFMINLADIDAALAKALELDPNLAGAYATRGMTRANSPVEDLDAATRDLEHAVKLDPNQPMALSWLATAYVAQGRIDEAISAQERGLAIDPFNVPLVLNSSERFLFVGNIDGAIEHVSRLLLLPEPPGPVYPVLSGYYELKRDFPAAIEWLKESIRKSGSTDFYSIGQLSFLYDLLGMRNEADYWFARYEESQSSPLLLLFHQTERYIELGETEKAAAFLQRFEDRQGFNMEKYPPQYETIFAEYYVALGRPEIGVAQLEERIGKDGSETDPDSTDVRTLFELFMLADGYEQLGMHERATATRTRGIQISDRLRDDEAFDADIESLFARAFVHGMSGDAIEGAALLDAAIDAGFGRLPWITVNLMRGKAFRAPEFADSVQKLESILAAQRDVVAAEDAKNDFRAEFEQMLKEPPDQAPDNRY